MNGKADDIRKDPADLHASTSTSQALRKVTMTPADYDDALRIGAAIRRARNDAGLTQTQLAELIDVSDRTLRDIERGAGTSGLTAVIAAANALGLHLVVQ